MPYNLENNKMMMKISTKNTKDMTRIIAIAFLLVVLPNLGRAQIGINTTTPRATLDVVGDPTNPTRLDGIKFPSITGDQLLQKTDYTAADLGAVVYVSAPATGPYLFGAANEFLDDKGLYIYDGSRWVDIKAQLLTVFIPNIIASGRSATGALITPTGNLFSLTNQLTTINGTGLAADGSFTAPADGLYVFEVAYSFRSFRAQRIGVSIGETYCDAPCTPKGVMGSWNDTGGDLGSTLYDNRFYRTGAVELTAGETLDAITFYNHRTTNFAANQRIFDIDVSVQRVID